MIVLALKEKRMLEIWALVAPAGMLGVGTGLMGATNGVADSVA
jgi:hypothetical protein